MERSILLSVILIMGIGFTSASDTPTEGVWDFNNYVARTAKSRYDFEIGRIKRIYDFEVNKAKRIYDSAVEKLTLTKNTETQIAQKELLSKLDETLLVETKAGRLDEALKIKNAIEEVKSGKEIIVKEDKSTKKNIPSCAVEYNGHHYLAVLRPVDWEKAKKLCEEMGGHLVYIEDKKEMEMLKKIIYSIFGKINLWVGALKTKDKWFWLNKKPIDKDFWAIGQPNAKTVAHIVVYQEGLRDVSNIVYQNHYGDVSGFICEWDN